MSPESRPVGGLTNREALSRLGKAVGKGAIKTFPLTLLGLSVTAIAGVLSATGHEQWTKIAWWCGIATSGILAPTETVRELGVFEVKDVKTFVKGGVNAWGHYKKGDLEGMTAKEVFLPKDSNPTH